MGQHHFLRLFVLLALACVAAGPAVAGARVVDLKASDGTKLSATYFDAGKPGPGVLLLHQCNRDRNVWNSLVLKLTAAGINVLTVDNRGFGLSGGEPHEKLTPQQEGRIESEKWPGDFDIAIEYLMSQSGVRRDMIGVGGASCGVNNSIQVARRHPEVKSLVLLSGPTSLQGRQFLRSSTQLPVFFAVADDDEFAGTVQTVEWLYSLTPNPGKKFVHYAQGGHGADMFPVHPELQGLIVDWYVTTLIKTLEEAHHADRKIELSPEGMVNYMGYEHLQSGDNKGAIEIFKVNVAEYPNSPNVYDSLSDGYFADGQKDLARQNAKRALELLTSDTTDNERVRNSIRDSAEGKLKKLGDSPQ